jgi:hypothetical protein
MKVSNRLTCGFAAVCLSLASTAGAQLPKGVTQADAAAIQSLMGRYAHALGSCDADGFADLFAPKTGYFASGFRGEIVGREGLKALVQSERHCIESAGSTPAPRPGGTDGPKVVLEAVSGKVHGVADLGRAGEYQDEYVHTSDAAREGRGPHRRRLPRDPTRARLEARRFLCRGPGRRQTLQNVRHRDQRPGRRGQGPCLPQGR